jgi:uncharacterized protein (TIGR00725 family)
MYNQPDVRDQWIALLGAAKRYEDFQLELGYRLGAAIAQAQKGLVTGATTGIPLAGAMGAKDHGGRVMGISPAENPREHTRHFFKPLAFHDTILYTGLGNDGRSPMIVRSASIAIFAGGEAGTLQEFAAAWLNGTPVIGVLRQSGGISDSLENLAGSFQTNFGSLIIASDSPEELVSGCLNVLQKRSSIVEGVRGDNDAVDPLVIALRHLRPKKGGLS